MYDNILRELAAKCMECGMAPEVFFTEKSAELDERKRILATPSLRWYRENSERLHTRISKALSRELTEYEKFDGHGLVSEVKRRLNPDSRDVSDQTAIKRVLMSESNGRCSVCGEILTEREAVIDHFLPLAEGGSNHPLNLRICCRLCNSGKKDLIEERAIAAARPWWEPRSNLTSGKTKVTACKRYCVLIRDKSTCRMCGANAKTTKLVVKMRLSEVDGGLQIYDNLFTVCEKCKS